MAGYITVSIGKILVTLYQILEDHYWRVSPADDVSYLTDLPQPSWRRQLSHRFTTAQLTTWAILQIYHSPADYVSYLTDLPQPSWRRQLSHRFITAQLTTWAILQIYHSPADYVSYLTDLPQPSWRELSHTFTTAQLTWAISHIYHSPGMCTTTMWNTRYQWTSNTPYLWDDVSEIYMHYMNA